jgi:hypothetical protein
VVTFDSAVTDLRYNVCATTAIPNGIQIHQPRVGGPRRQAIRAGLATRATPFPSPVGAAVLADGHHVAPDDASNSFVRTAMERRRQALGRNWTPNLTIWTSGLLDRHPNGRKTTVFPGNWRPFTLKTKAFLKMWRRSMQKQSCSSHNWSRCMQNQSGISRDTSRSMQNMSGISWARSRSMQNLSGISLARSPVPRERTPLSQARRPVLDAPSPLSQIPSPVLRNMSRVSASCFPV